MNITEDAVLKAEQERFAWKTFALLFPEVNENVLEKLRDDLAFEMSTIDDEQLIEDISSGLSCIEILLSLFNRVGSSLCSKELRKTAAKRVKEAAKSDVAGKEHIEHALTHETLLSTALDLQELCEQRLEELGTTPEHMYMRIKCTDASMGPVSPPLPFDRTGRSAKEDVKRDSEEDEDIMIGIDNHSPSKFNYPLPGQWRSKHFRQDSREVELARQKNDWIGMNMSQHHHHVKEHLGTTNGLPIARWAGSLRDNANYADLVQGSRPMRFSKSLGEDGRALNAAKADAVRMAKASSSTSFSGTFNENLAASYAGAKASAGGTNGIVGATKKKNERRKRVNDYMKKLKDYTDGKKFSYPIPGQTKSKHFKGGKDSFRAKQRPYVGMDMNTTRMHIKVGTASGKSSSHWIGSLRSKAKGAPGGVMHMPQNYTPETKAPKVTGDAEAGQSGAARDSIDAQGRSKYIGNKTDAMMDGVPESMRRYKPQVSLKSKFSPDRAFLRLADQLATPLINEHVAKFTMRENLRSKKATRLHIKALDKEKQKKESERRNRRREYGEKAAERFKEEKAKRLAALKSKQQRFKAARSSPIRTPPKTPQAN